MVSGSPGLPMGSDEESWLRKAESSAAPEANNGGVAVVQVQEEEMDKLVDDAPLSAAATSATLQQPQPQRLERRRALGAGSSPGSSGSPLPPLVAAPLAPRPSGDAQPTPRQGRKLTMIGPTGTEVVRRRFVEVVIRRLGHLHQRLSFDLVYATVEDMEQKELSALLKSAVEAGASMKEVIQRFENPSAFPLSAPFSDTGAEFTPQQSIIALLLSLDAGHRLLESPEIELRQELARLSLSALRERASSSSVCADKICDAVGSASEVATLVEVILDAELKLTCLWPVRRCRLPRCSKRFRESGPRNYAELSAIDHAQVEERTKSYKKSMGKAPPQWLQNTPLEGSAIYQILSSFRGTVLPWAAKDMRLWLSMSVFFGIRLMIRSGAKSIEFPMINGTGFATIGGFLTFFLVFYAGQAYTRFAAQYSAAMNCKGRIMSICGIARVCMAAPSGVRLCRHLNAAHALGFVGLSETFSVQNFVEPLSPASVGPSMIETVIL